LPELIEFDRIKESVMSIKDSIIQLYSRCHLRLAVRFAMCFKLYEGVALLSDANVIEFTTQDANIFYSLRPSFLSGVRTSHK
jgi:hypothetical protein